MMMQSSQVPVIDLENLLNGQDAKTVAKEIGSACRDKGFFYITGHGISPKLEQAMEELAADFFKREETYKARYSMSKAGRAWRGYFPVGGELTSGKPDWKEGFYFGEEHADDHPGVLQKRPLYGKNLFPDIPSFRLTVLQYMQAMTQLGHKLMTGIALSLELPADYFFQNYTHDPITLFRIFHYPPPPPSQELLWGVGEHTDYGLLTLLKQDGVGGLQVKAAEGWIDAPPLPNTYVCNIGDMLDRLTAGLYRSTPHRVLNRSTLDRYSFPFFFDPGFDAAIKRLPLTDEQLAQIQATPGSERWDQTDIQTYQGSYGDYLLKKIGKVFPDLKAKALKP